MSEISNKANIFGKQLNVVITNGNETQLQQLIQSNTPVDAKNSLIISVQSDNEGKDIQGSASLWVSDSNGYLIQLTKPIGN